MKTKTHKFAHFRILNMTKCIFKFLKVVVFFFTVFQFSGSFTHLKVSSWHCEICR